MLDISVLSLCLNGWSAKGNYADCASRASTATGHMLVSKEGETYIYHLRRPRKKEYLVSIPEKERKEKSLSVCLPPATNPKTLIACRSS